jgi:hypothetical protein
VSVGQEKLEDTYLNQAVILHAVKAAAGLQAKLREVIRVRGGTPPSPTERRRDGRTLCWRCRKPGLFRMECRQRPHEECQISEARRRPPTSPPSPRRFTLNVLAKGPEDRLIADGWIQEKPCFVTMDAGAFVTVARPDIVVGLPERQPSRQYILQVLSGQTIPIVKKALVDLNLGQRTLKTRVFVADITDEFILGLDILRAYDASVDVRRHVRRLGQEEMPVREPPTTSVLTRSRPTESHRNRRPVCWQCGGTSLLRKECSRRPARDMVDKRDWRRDCATGGRRNVSRQMADSTPLLD